MDKRRTLMRDLMNEKSLSYRDLANLTGISYSALQRYVTGETTKMSIDYFEKIAAALHVSPAYLMGWEDKTKTSVKYYNEDAVTPEEMNHIKKYRSLAPEGKNVIDNLIENLLAMQQPPADNDLPDINEARRRLAEIETREKRAARLIAYKGKDNPTPVVYPTDEEVEAAKKLLEKDTIDFDNLD